MSAWLIIFVGLIYAGISVEQFMKGNTGMGLTFAGYAFSNYGLYRMAA